MSISMSVSMFLSTSLSVTVTVSVFIFLFMFIYLLVFMFMCTRSCAILPCLSQQKTFRTLIWTWKGTWTRTVIWTWTASTDILQKKTDNVGVKILKFNNKRFSIYMYLLWYLFWRADAINKPENKRSAVKLINILKVKDRRWFRSTDNGLFNGEQKFCPTLPFNIWIRSSDGLTK